MELLLFVIAVVGIGLLIVLYHIYTILYNFYVELKREDTLFAFSRLVTALESFNYGIRKLVEKRGENK